ncbi:ABC-type Fe3+/spermidine/putrescine transport system ATPase subunit [Arthrobacter sp. UYEF21]
MTAVLTSERTGDPANVAIGLPTGCSAKEGKAKVSRLLELVGLDSFAVRRPREVSGGMAQRASLARALARNPGVLLLDVVLERSDLDVDAAPSEAQRKVLEKIGPTFVETGDVKTQQQIDDAVGSLLDDSLVKKADPSAIKGS